MRDHESAKTFGPVSRWFAGWICCTAGLIGMGAAVLAVWPPSRLATPAPAGPARERLPGAVVERYGDLPLPFEPNVGQPGLAGAEAFPYVARAPDHTVLLSAREIVFAGNVEPLRLRFVGANPAAEAVALDRLPGHSNYFAGQDPAAWRTNVPHYARVQFRDVYPGIDLVCYGKRGRLEYDWIVAPGADPGMIRVEFLGTREISAGSDGTLRVQTGSGEVVHRRPLLYQRRGTTHHAVAGGYRLMGRRQAGYSVGAYDRATPLVVDPVVEYFAIFGGSGYRAQTGSNGSIPLYTSYYDSGWAIAADGAGNAYLAGLTNSTDFPLVNPLRSTTGQGSKIFVSKLNTSGTALMYSTYLGAGTTPDGVVGLAGVAGIAVDAGGNAFVTGSLSNDLPVTSALQPRNVALVLKLDPNGSLVYSASLGFVPTSIALDSGGNAYVAGSANEDIATTPGAYQSTLRRGACIGGGPIPGVDR